MSTTTLNKIITNKGNEVVIDLNDPLLKEHFEATSSFTNVIINQINTEGLYTEYFKDLRKKATILDIGANVGIFSLYAQDGKNKVYALEPTPEHFALLEKTTNDFTTIKRFNVALAPYDGNIEFYLCDTNTTMNSIANGYGKSIIVDGIRLDSFIEKNKIKTVDFIKIDIEGSEMLALTEEIIANVKDKVKVWFLEVHATDDSSLQQNRKILKERFKNCGIEVVNIGNDG